MVATSMQSFEGQSGQFKPYSPFNRKPVELTEKCTVPVICLYFTLES